MKLIASEKVLTPDYVAIARAFMMSAGCIRGLLAIMGVNKISELNKSHLIFKESIID